MIASKLLAGGNSIANVRFYFKANPMGDGMLQTVYALGAAAVAAGVVVAVLGSSPQVQARASSRIGWIQL